MQLLRAEYMLKSGAVAATDLYQIYLSLQRFDVPSEDLHYRVAVFCDGMYSIDTEKVSILGVIVSHFEKHFACRCEAIWWRIYWSRTRMRCALDAPICTTRCHECSPYGWMWVRKRYVRLCTAQGIRETALMNHFVGCAAHLHFTDVLRQFECVFGLLYWPPIVIRWANQRLILPMAPIHRPRSDGKLDWPIPMAPES